MSLRLTLLKVAERARKLSGPSFADIRDAITIRTRTWSGSTLKSGTATDADLVLPPHYPIREISSQEIFTSGGQYEVGDFLVDHITPSDGAGVGWTPEQLKPRVTTNNVEIIYLIDGQDGEFRCISIKTLRPFTYQLVLRKRR